MIVGVLVGEGDVIGACAREGWGERRRGAGVVPLGADRKRLKSVLAEKVRVGVQSDAGSVANGSGPSNSSGNEWVAWEAAVKYVRK